MLLSIPVFAYNPSTTIAPVVEAQVIEVPKVKTAQEIVHEHFGVNAKVMIAIAQCESGQRQFRASSTPLISPTNDVGFMQINIKTWDSTAVKLGLDYRNNIEDNIKMARYILDHQGFTAWTTYNNGCYKQYL